VVKRHDNGDVTIIDEEKDEQHMQMDDEVEEVLGKKAEQPKLKVGDKAKVTEMSAPMVGFQVGDIVTIIEDDKGDYCPIKIEKANGSTGYTTMAKLEPVEEAKEVTKHTFKVGDIVTGVKGKYSFTNDEMTKGEVIKELEDGRIEVKILEHAADRQIGFSYRVDPKYFVPVKEQPKYIRMLRDDHADDYYKGDIFEVHEDSLGNKYFVDRAGDNRYLSEHPHEFTTKDSEKVTTKRDVVEYLRKISADEMLDIIEEARN